MANNRMWLVNKYDDTQRILLAKYYPSDGWYFPWDNGQSLRLEEGADFREVFNKMLDKENSPVSVNYGDNPWVIEYETTEEDIEKIEGMLSPPVDSEEG